MKYVSKYHFIASVNVKFIYMCDHINTFYSNLAKKILIHFFYNFKISFKFLEVLRKERELKLHGEN